MESKHKSWVRSLQFLKQRRFWLFLSSAIKKYKTILKDCELLINIIYCHFSWGKAVLILKIEIDTHRYKKKKKPTHLVKCVIFDGKKKSMLLSFNSVSDFIHHFFLLPFVFFYWKKYDARGKDLNRWRLFSY